MVHLQLVLDKAATKMNGWQGSLINLGGRRELVKMVLSSLPVYLLVAIKVPKRFYKEFDKLRRRFRWARNKELQGGKCKVSWARVCRPLRCGGLGVVDLARFSRALRIRWLWLQWIAPDKPWCGSVLPVDETDRILFAVATRVTVRNGRKASFWTSSWLDGMSLAGMFPALLKHSKRKNRSVADAMADDNWIRDLMQGNSTTLFIDYIMLWTLIDAATLDLSQSQEEEDSIVWTMSADGLYTTKSAYSMQFYGSMASTYPAKVWQVWAQSRCKFFIWLILQNRVWTADRLLLRELQNKYFCQLCRRNLETVHHLFMECPVARQVWTEVSNWAGVGCLHPQTWNTCWDVPAWFTTVAERESSTRGKGIQSLLILVCWALWRERNARVFDDREKQTSRLVVGIKDEVWLWVRAGAKLLADIVRPLVPE
jgi:hypothetical protein